MRTFLIMLSLTAICLAGCPLPTEQEIKYAEINWKIEREKQIRDGVTKAIIDHGNGVYTIKSEDFDIQGRAISIVKAKHPNQIPQILEKKEGRFGNAISGTGKEFITIELLVIFK
ncbi:MAG: hypothetical protein NTW79_00185 [Candidatus Berkelbacteria bacterium]|nr:hypothetical protein [Candidatus Berkelbacteria bacterium]